MWNRRPTILRGLIDLCYPPDCILCGVDLGDDALVADSASNSVGLCTACNTAFPPLPTVVCSKCGVPVPPFSACTIDCVHCRADRYKFKGTFALGRYDGLLREAILLAKQPSGARVARWLADRWLTMHRERLAETDWNAIVAVPRHWFRVWQHAHAPALTIAARIAARGGVLIGKPLPLRPWLSRRRLTPRQSTSSATERRSQQKDSFVVPRRWRTAVQGAQILLVDDVLTTGGTANAATAALLDAGAKVVQLAVIARGLGGT